jgi:hypothetical protein
LEKAGVVGNGPPRTLFSAMRIAAMPGMAHDPVRERRHGVVA